MFEQFHDLQHEFCFRPVLLFYLHMYQ